MSDPLDPQHTNTNGDGQGDADATMPQAPNSPSEKPMTNKEKRKATQAAKRAAREQREAEAQVQATTTAAPTPTKRKRDADDDGHADAGADEATAAADGEADGDDAAEPLSHKEQRRRRKLEKRAKLEGKQTGSAAAAAGGAPQPSSSTSRSSTAPAQIKRSPWCVWVANMRFTTTEERLKEYLEENGIEGISRVHMPRGPRKEEANKGFAYVDLASPDMVDRAIALSESRLDGRNLLIKSGNDFQGRPAISATAASLAMTALGTAPRTAPSTTAGAAAATTKKPTADDDDDEQQQPGPNDTIAFSALPSSIVRGKTGLTKTAQKVLRSQKNPPGPTLFLGNLGFETTEEGIRSLLENSAKRREEWRRADKRDKREQRKMRKQRKRTDAAGESDDEESSSSSSSSSSSGSDSDSDGESEEATTTTTTTGGRTKKAATKKPSSGGGGGIRGAGIRKIRMGTFQDSGKCKGFAFVDFHTPEHATASLIDGRNAHLDGRSIILQYAGADAIRRGAPKGTITGGPRPVARARTEVVPRVWGQKQGGDEEGEGERERERLRATAPEPGSFDATAPMEKRHKETKEERMARRAAGGASADGGAGVPGVRRNAGGEERKRRARPGAALANAQREKVGIVQSEGRKTTFD